MLKKLLAVGVLIFVLPFLYLGIAFNVAELIVFSMFIVALFFWFAYLSDPYMRLENETFHSINYLKIGKYVLVSFIEVFVIYTFVNVLMFSEFRLSDILTFSYLFKVFTLITAYWFIYFMIRLFSSLGR